MKKRMNSTGPLRVITLLVLVFAFCACFRSAAAQQARSSGAAASAPAWTQFQDPMEHAFSVQVPRGWTVRGGLFRLGFSDERVMVDVRSPDGKIAVRIGDVAVPSYAPPNPYHPREGEVYDLGAQAQLIVARYRTGPEYAVLYSQARFHELCQNPQPDSADAGFQVPDHTPLDGAGKTSAGQIAWRCQMADGPRVVFAYTRTLEANGIWQAPAIVSFIAPPERSSLARSVAYKMADSFQLNPEWMEHQKQMDAEGMAYQRWRQQGRIGELQQQMRQFEAKMQAEQNQVNSFERHQAIEAGGVQEFDNALVGVTPTTDPLTGEHRDVWTGTKSNYWANGQGTVINSTDQPGAGYYQLPPDR
ncbi:MAG TPA: hypothetical protein VGR47_01670 [Terracidiphilus sp.]|nr:hypothetical protein [Terracidiphilus sp.]